MIYENGQKVKIINCAKLSNDYKRHAGKVVTIKNKIVAKEGQPIIIDYYWVEENNIAWHTNELELV